MTRSLKLAIVSLSSFLLVVLILGAVLGQGRAAEEPYRHFAVYTEVLSRIKSEYVEEPNMNSVTLGALNGLLESVDPYASYLSADQFRQYLKSQDGKRPSVGLVLSRRVGYLGVIGAIPGTPAAAANLQPGDVIESINSVSTRDMPLAYAQMLLEGDAGSTVELSVIRVRKGNESEPVKLIRAAIAMPALTEKKLKDGISYLKISTLEAGRTAQVRQALQRFDRSGAQKLVIDMRYCALGSAEEGVALADVFVDKGLLTYTLGQKSPRKDYSATAAASDWKKPLAVLINRGTAAGCEIAASALAQTGRATSVGERTYGDAGVRKPITMDDGSAVILSVAKYYSPDGKAIQDNGVAPLVPIAEFDFTGQSPDDIDENILLQPPTNTPGTDRQLDKAIEVLEKGVKAAGGTDADAAAAAVKGGDLGAKLPDLPVSNVPKK
jgi:carboxyl-terminal processing protease